jgi:hypothetical protein
MRLVRLFLVGLVPVGLIGCVHEADRPAWMNRIPLLRATPEPDSALLAYVIVERTAGGDDVNRKVWDRIDEQLFPFETRTVLEDAGLRVGTASESTPGPLRKMIEDPRTGGGHRGRTFALDKPAPLFVSGAVPRATFALPAADGHRINFNRTEVALGFEVTVRDAPDGKVFIKLVPHAKYREPNQLVPTEGLERDQGLESFPAAGFEVALSPTEYLVVGTDSHRDGTFGHAALTGPKDDRVVQRLLVLRAGRTRPEHSAPTNSDSQAVAPPLVTQATMARGVSP